ncbi:MAG: MBL fold metallo-hydrolase [Hamadaea sp.]|uniref:MBL fold metallo-hydrolase RNA specificity domain-containing protein n=1 Tax=Hamadaea sp. TaxID=2024425 RepID=UPI0017E90A49|nr:MBL fold metallo-hydrolase [Hamadaea sp.]NUT18891.1 MBL fold metallo-hydrolase [Hamadaea sp.]
MYVTFLGAAGTVTGSRFLVEQGETQLLVDCGMFQGERELRRRNWDAFPIAPSGLAAVVVSHAHLDHIGWLPRLVAEGFTGSVLLTPDTGRLGSIVLRDAAHLQEEDAEYARRAGYSKHRPPLPLFDSAAAEKAIALFRPIDHGRRTQVAPGVDVMLRRAGHILGSATIEVRAGGRSVVFSGDLGNPDHPLLRPPEPPPAADAIVVESTYGDRDRPPRDLGDFAAALTKTLGRGGVVLIPAFAVDRTAVLLTELRSLMLSGRIPNAPIYVDSPMALAALDVYRRALTNGGPQMRPQPATGDPFETGTLHACRTVDESKALNETRMPCIIISASGMATGGRVVHHLAGLAPDPRNLIALVGFQVAGTRGRALLDGAHVIKAHGRYIPVRAQVEGFDEFSCHADADELLAWLAAAPRPPQTCFAVHGEVHAAQELASRVDQELGWCAVVPRPGERVRI